MQRLIKIFAKNDYRSLSAKPSTIFGYVALGFVVLFFLFFFGAFLSTLGAILPREHQIIVINYSLFLFALALLIFTIPLVFNRLFSESDLELLFTLPLKVRQIFWAKFVYNLLGVPLLLLVVAIICMLIFGVGAGAPIMYYVIGTVVLIFITFIAICLAYLINLILIKIIPPNKAKELLTAVSAMSGIIFYLGFQLFNVNVVMNEEELDFSSLPTIPEWLPTHWGAVFIDDAMQGQWSGSTLLFGLGLVIVTVALVVITSIIVEKALLKGWVNISESRSKKKKQRKKGQAQLKGVIRMISRKEWLMIKRDIREWSTVLPMVIILILPFVNFSGLDGGFAELRDAPHISWPTMQMSFSFLAVLAAGIFTAGSIGREERLIDLLKVLPLSGWQISLGKFQANAFIMIISMTILQIIAAIILQWTIWSTVLGILAISGIMLGSVSIGLFIGCIGSKYNEKNPQNRVDTGSSILMMMLFFAYLLIIAIPTAVTFFPGSYAQAIIDSNAEGQMLPTFIVNMLDAGTASSLIAFTVYLLIIGGITWVCLSSSAKRINEGIEIRFEK